MSSFGSRGYGQQNNPYQEYGSATTLEVPGSFDASMAPDEIALQRVVVQGNQSPPSLIQTGLYRSGTNIQLDTCGTSVNEYMYYMEYHPAGQNSYYCQVVGVAPSLETDYYEVFSFPYQATGNWWWLVFTGSNVGFGGEQYIGGLTANPAVGEELTTPGACQASQSWLAAFYAYPLSFSGIPDDWYVFFQANGNDAQPIVNPRNTYLYYPTNTGLWSIPNVPFNETLIDHQGSTSCDTNQGNG